jgi:hypothetical protein
VPGHPGPVRSLVRVVREAFGTADLRHLEFAWASTSVAHWSGIIALAVYGYGEGGATAVGLIGLARMVPAGLVSPFASLLGDRHSRRDVLAVCSGLRLIAGLALGGSVLMGAPLAAVIAIASLKTIVGVAYKPAQAALLPQLARSPRQMAAANAIWTGVDSAGFIAGSLLGAVLIATLSASSALALTAVPYGLAGLFVIAITRDKTPEHREMIEDVHVRDEILAGFRTIAATPQLRTIVSTLSAAMLIEGMIDALVVIVGLQTLDLSEAGVGVLNSMWGVGGMVGGVVALSLLGRGRLAGGLVTGLVLMGSPLIILAVGLAPGVALPALVVVGAGYALVVVAGLTLLQRLASDEVLSRVFGVVESTSAVSMGVGAALAPALVSFLGAAGALTTVGVSLPLLALLRWRTLARFEAGRAIPERQFGLLRGVPLFAPLPVGTIENLALRLHPVEVQAGTTICTQGEPGDRFYVIDEGEFEVLVDGAHRRVEGPGEYFGEIALLQSVPRTASVRAVAPGRLFALDSDDFIASVTGHPRSVRAADAVMTFRLDAPDPGAAAPESSFAAREAG